MTTRSAIVVLVTGLLAHSAAAQDPAPPQVPSPIGDVTLHHEPPREAPQLQRIAWAIVGANGRTLEDVRTHLEELQRRFEGEPVRITVLMPEPAAKALAATKPRFAVAGTAQELRPLDTPELMVTDANGATPSSISLDYAEDTIAALLADERVAETLQGLLVAENQLSVAGDAGSDAGAVAMALDLFPHSGRARALAVLDAWWRQGDHKAALAAVDSGLQALAGRTLPLCEFVDLVSRGDSSDPALIQRLAMEMAPVAAAAGDNPFAQLVHLRVLLRANRTKLAERLAKRLDTQLQKRGDPELRLRLAEVLMDAADPRPFRALAEAQLAAVADSALDLEEMAMVRHKVLRRCGDEAGAAALLKQHHRDDSASMLNNPAWYVCVRLDTMGRFPDWANDLADRMLGIDRERLESNYRDTVALALFCAGRVEAAAEQQQLAIGEHPGDPRYAGRLRRYEDALARQRRVPPPTPSPK